MVVLQPSQEIADCLGFNAAISLPGVFAVGDAHSGNVKRVASAVGEGAIAIHPVHGALAEL